MMMFDTILGPSWFLAPLGITGGHPLAFSALLSRRKRARLPCLDVEFRSDGPVWHANKNDAASLNFLRNGVAWSYIMPTAGNHVYSAGVCTWKDGHAGAVSLNYDDGYMTSYDNRLLLEVHGFKATYFPVASLSDDDPTPGRIGYPEMEVLYAADHEIGCHTVNHWCDFYNRIPDPYEDYVAYAAAEYGAWYTQYLAALTIPEEQLRFSLAYPGGSRNTDLDAAAASHVQSVRGYNSTDDALYPGRLVGLNSPTPPSPDGVMLLSVYSSTDGYGTQENFANQAVAAGKWAIFVRHADTYTAVFLAALADIDAWVAPQGRVVEYLTVRDSLEVSGFSVVSDGLNRTIQFTISDSIGLDQDYYDCDITIKVAVAEADHINSVKIDGSPVAWIRKRIDGIMYLLFDGSLLTSHTVVVEVTAAVAAGDEPATTNIIQQQAENVACYDPSKGIWVRPSVTNMVPYNAGADSLNSDYWTSTDITATDGSSDVYVYDDTSVKLTSTGADATYAVQSAALTADAYYMVGFPVITIDNDIDAARLAELIVPTVLQSSVECCLGNPRARRLGVFYRGTHTYRVYEIWDIVLATASAAATVAYKMPATSQVTYVGAITMHPVTSGQQWYQWLGPLPQLDDSQVSTNAETLQLVCATPTNLLPIKSDKAWAIEIEAAFPFNARLDWNTVKGLLPYHGYYLIGWAQSGYGYMSVILYSTSSSRYRLRTNAEAGPGEEDQYAVVVPSFTAMQSQWWGLTSKSGTPAQLWQAKATRDELFKDTSDDTQSAAQESQCKQLSNGVMLMGVTSSSALSTALAGTAPGGLLRRVVFRNKRMI